MAKESVLSGLSLTENDPEHMSDDPSNPSPNSYDIFDLKMRDFAVSLMEHLAVATFVLDLDGKVIIWNRACHRLTGVPASDVLGTSDHWRAFYDHQRETLADLVLLRRTGETDNLYAINHGNGSIRNGLSAENWCEMPRIEGRHYLAIDSGPIYDDKGELIAVVETIRDITVQKQAQTALELLAMRDGLTGLANRRCFDQTLELEWRRCRREQKSLALLIIDVDNFKQYNDTHGHLGGDDCLKRIAVVLAKTVHRGGDLVARYGGEEFAVILPDPKRDGAIAVAERIRCAVEDLNVSEAGTAVSKEITVSIGVASTKGVTGKDITSLITSADKALYEAKNSGRNRVVISTI